MRLLQFCLKSSIQLPVLPYKSINGPIASNLGVYRQESESGVDVRYVFFLAARMAGEGHKIKKKKKSPSTPQSEEIATDTDTNRRIFAPVQHS